MEKKNSARRVQFYETSYFMWCFLFIFPPLGLISLWICHRDLSRKKRVLITLIGLLWFSVLFYANHNAALKRKLDPSYGKDRGYSVESVIDRLKESSKNT